MPPDLEHTVTSMLAAKQPPSGTELTELYERGTPPLYSWVALNLRSGLSARIDVEDVVQETWLRALRGLRGFDPAQGSFRAWLIGIARNVLLEAFRALAAQPAGGGSMANFFLLANRPDSATSVTRDVARMDSVRQFIERVSTLGEDERVLVLCCGLEGLGHAEAALRLGITPAAAAKRWQRLRATLVGRDLPRELLAG
jgi:RNA polymerase sigma-70 factor (ECF subfamily)